MTPSAELPRRSVPGSPFSRPAEVQAPAAVYSVGDRVCHDRHGLGTVLVVGYPDVLRIDFGSAGVHELPSSDPQLSAL